METLSETITFFVSCPFSGGINSWAGIQFKNLENIGLRNLSIAATNESNPTGQMNGFCAGQMQTGNEQKQSNLAWNNADTQIIRSQVLKKFPE